MQKLDKKQMPQFVGLCVLSTGVFGYFTMRMVTPSPAAAATRPVLKPTVTETTPAVARAAGTAPAPAEIAAVVPPPAPGMRDPFLVGYTDPKTVKAALPALTGPPPGGPAPTVGPRVATAQIATAQIANPLIHELAPAPVSGLMVPGFPAAPPLPSAAAELPPSQKIMPLPAPPPAPPKWSVTGLLQSGTGGVAILRDGDSRRFVRVGDFLDGVFRVASVTRSSVVLRHGKTFYTLPLGTAAEKLEAKPGSQPQAKPETQPETQREAKPETKPAPASVPAPGVPALSAPPAPALPRQSQTAPAFARRQAALASALPLRFLDGAEMVADTPSQKVASVLH